LLSAEQEKLYLKKQLDRVKQRKGDTKKQIEELLDNKFYNDYTINID
jgi:hypothetical protein